MMPPRFAVHEMGDLEDSVCRASNSAAMALLAVESITSGGEQAWSVPLTEGERELLYFAVAEVCDYAEKAKAEFYKLGEEAADAT